MPLRPSGTRRLPAWAPVLLVFAVTLLAYWPSLHGGILWDDPAHLTRPDLRSWSGLWRILTRIGTTQEYYPVLHGAFWVEHRLWGEWLPGYHLLNVVLHAGSACLLALVVRRLWSGPAGSPADAATPRRVPAGAEWLAALLFAVHPVAVESVAWMTEQKNTLSLGFGLLAVLAYLRFVDGRRARDYALALLCFALALGAKTTTIVLPPALLVLAWWRTGRLELRRDVLPLVPWFAAALVAGLVTVRVETNYVGAHGAAYALTAVERTLLAARIVWFYLGKLLWPHPLIFFYPRWDVPAAAAGWWGAALALAAATVSLWMVRRRTRGPLAAWLLFIGALFPVLGFLNVFAFVFSYVADHFQYLPLAVFSGAAAAGLALAVNAVPGRVRRVAGAAVAAILAGLALQTHRLSALYRSNETLFGAVVARNPGAWMAHEILATAAAKAGDASRARAEYRTVLRLKPDHPDAYSGLGLELINVPGRQAEAIADYEEALRLRPQFVEAHYNLGIALARMPGRRAEALMHLKVAVGLEPYFTAGQVALGNLLAEDPATRARALPHFEQALRFAPDDGATHRDYADALARLGRTADAVQEYETALRLVPRDAVAEFHLADVLVATRHPVPEAIAHYEAAVRLNPDLAGAQAHLASVLSSLPERRAEALRHAQAAVRLEPGDAEARNILGILYAEGGELAKARREWQRALQINPRFTDARRNLERLAQLAPGRGE